ncbi:enoyl-CoA hydratase/isomerase family protein [Bradyrhizobium neotropicale]|uniref:enoyl-CoA hydratase/isomerase family protein n=1 Tax=Bradyrhizobium neotropicale TaxID=1497615 RepID=UPI001AD7A6F6|nr:enoyl-CoA hydratase/isomerase family protein [Bradyrhizobium neotropicale]MBO4225271.1 enoyl-CoA hydratase/isomerase family protein [Bradyrhizobium neotropicale]
MSGYTTISVIREGAVDWLTLNRPERLNALNATMVCELWDYFDGLQCDYSRRIVVMRGAGRAFCAGLDLVWFNNSQGSMPRGATDKGPGPSLADIVLKMRSCPQVIISLVHGAACGGGFNFALASDIRIAGRSAKMNVAFVKLGLSGCELGTSYFLPRMVGTSVAAELMMTGRFVLADRALAAGLVSQVVDDDQLEDAARVLIDDLLAASPMGLRKTKEVLTLAAESEDLATVIRLEEHTQRVCMEAGSFAQTVDAFGRKKVARAEEKVTNATS